MYKASKSFGSIPLKEGDSRTKFYYFLNIPFTRKFVTVLTFSIIPPVWIPTVITNPRYSMHSTLPPSKGQDLIHRNRLQKLRNQELNTTKSQLTSLHKSIQQRVSIEEELVDTLLVAQQALTTKDATICTLQTELHSLLATKALTQNKERMMAEVKLMSLKNNQLQEAQYHLSMAQADQEIQSLKQQILLHEVRETKQKVEFNSLTSRVGQLQQTVRNVTQLRQKEEHQYQEKIKQVVQQIHWQEKMLNIPKLLRLNNKELLATLANNGSRNN